MVNNICEDLDFNQTDQYCVIHLADLTEWVKTFVIYIFRTEKQNFYEHALLIIPSNQINLFTYNSLEPKSPYMKF